MRDLMDFCIYVLKAMVKSWFGLSLGSYSFGDFLVASLVISVFLSSLVISFRSSASPGREVRPTRWRDQKSNTGQEG